MLIWILGAVIIVILVICFILWHRNKQSYQNQPPTIQKIRQMFKKITPSKGDIPIREGPESYTMNKSSITLCLKDPKSKEEYEWNTLSYVALHELAHVMTKQLEKDKNGKKMDHGPIFKRNFALLLKKAEELGYYDPRKVIPDSYCGV
jgi:beta-lactamase regulating signal transducer with metallopeptidase domain